MVFEGWVATLCNTFLGSYVVEGCFRPEKVSTSIYSGHMVLSELELRSEAFDFLDAPIKLKRGFIGRIEFTIPWAKVGSKPVEISIDRVFLVFTPQTEFSNEECAHRMKSQKAASLAINTGSSDSWQQNNGDATKVSEDNFAMRIVNKIIDNMEVKIRNVHIRYEDTRGVEQPPFGLGITLESFKVQSTDNNWIPRFVDLGKEVQARLADSGRRLPKLLAYKLIEFESIAIYLDPVDADYPTSSLDYDVCTFAELSAVFERLISKQKYQEDQDIRFMDNHVLPKVATTTEGMSIDEAALRDILSAAAVEMSQSKHHHRFLIRPVSATLRVKSNRDPRFPESPDIVADFHMENLTFAVERFQVVHLLTVMSEFVAAERASKYRMFRPKVPIRGNAKIWWQFVVKATMKDVHEKLSRSSPSYISQRRKDRLQYMLLWKRNLVGGVWNRNRGLHNAHHSNSQDEDSVQNSPVRLKREVLKHGTTAIQPKSGMFYLELNTQERATLEEMEERLDSSDILFFRSLAESQLRVERAQMRVAEFGNRTSEKNSLPAATWGSSALNFASWVVGMNGNVNSNNASGRSSRSLGMTREEEQSVFEMLDFDPTSILQNKRKGSPGRVVAVFRLQMDSASLELWETTPTGSPQILMDGHFDNFGVHVYHRENGTQKLRVSLETLVLYDRCTSQFKFSRLIAPKEIALGMDTMSSGISTTLSDIDGMSYITPPSWSGAAERMERNYLQRTLNTRRKQKQMDDRRKRMKLFRSGAAAGAATLGDVASEGALDTEAVINNDSDEDEFEGYASDDDSVLASGKFPLKMFRGSSRRSSGYQGSRRGSGRVDLMERTPVFSLQIDTLVPKGSADLIFKVRMLPLEIVYSQKLMDKLDEFFEPPPSTVEFKEFEFATINSFTSTKSVIDAKIEYAFRNHVAISMDVDFQAPLIVIPQNTNGGEDEATKLLLIDLGRITIRDRVLSSFKKTSNSKGASRTRRAVDDAQVTQDPSQFFDEYAIAVSKMQVVVTDTLQPWRSTVEQRDAFVHILDDVSFKIVVCVSILPYDRTLPQLKIFASLPPLHLRLNPEKLASLQDISASYDTVVEPTTEPFMVNYAGQLKQLAVEPPCIPSPAAERKIRAESIEETADDFLSLQGSPRNGPVEPALKFHKLPSTRLLDLDNLNSADNLYHTENVADDSCSIVESLSQTLHERIPGETEETVDTFPEDDFYTTVGGSVHGGANALLRQGSSESVSSFMSAIQGDDETIAPVTPHKAKINMSLLQCSLSIDAVMISFCRPKLKAAKSIKAAASEPATEQPSEIFREADTEEQMSPLVNTVLNPYVKDWLNEVQQVADLYPSTPSGNSKPQKSKQWVSHDSGNTDSDQDTAVGRMPNDVYIEEGLIVAIFDGLDTNIMLRTLDRNMDLSIRGFSIRDILEQDMSEARDTASMLRDYWTSFQPILLSRNPEENTDTTKPSKPAGSMSNVSDFGTARGSRMPQPLDSNHFLTLNFETMTNYSSLYRGTNLNASLALEPIEVFLDRTIIEALLHFVALVQNKVSPASKGPTNTNRDSNLHQDLEVYQSRVPHPEESALLSPTPLFAEVKILMNQISVVLVDSQLGQTKNGSESANLNRPNSKILAELVITDAELKLVTYVDERSTVLFSLGDVSMRDMITDIGNMDYVYGNVRSPSTTFTIPEQEADFGENGDKFHRGSLLLGSTRRQGDQRPLLILKFDSFPESYRRKQLLAKDIRKFRRNSFDSTGGTAMARQASELDMDNILDSFMSDASDSGSVQSPRTGGLDVPNVDPDATDAPTPLLALRQNVKFQLRSFAVRVNVKFASEILETYRYSEIVDTASKLFTTKATSQEDTSAIMHYDAVTKVHFSFHDLAFQFPSSQTGSPVGSLIVDKTVIENHFYFGLASRAEQLEILRQHPSYGSAMHIIERFDIAVQKISFQFPVPIRRDEYSNMKVIRDFSCGIRIVHAVGSAMVRDIPNANMWQWQLLVNGSYDTNQVRKAHVRLSAIRTVVSEQVIVGLVGMATHLSSFSVHSSSIDGYDASKSVVNKNRCFSDNSLNAAPPNSVFSMDMELSSFEIQVNTQSNDYFSAKQGRHHTTKSHHRANIDAASTSLVSMRLNQLQMSCMLDFSSVTMSLRSIRVSDARPAFSRKSVSTWFLNSYDSESGSPVFNFRMITDVDGHANVEGTISKLSMCLILDIIPDLLSWFDHLHLCLEDAELVPVEHPVVREGSTDRAHSLSPHYSSVNTPEPVKRMKSFEAYSMAPAHSWASDSDTHFGDAVFHNTNASSRQSISRISKISLKVSCQDVEIELVENPKRSDSKVLRASTSGEVSSVLQQIKKPADSMSIVQFELKLTSFKCGVASVSTSSGDHSDFTELIVLPFSLHVVHRRKGVGRGMNDLTVVIHEVDARITYEQMRLLSRVGKRLELLAKSIEASSKRFASTSEHSVKEKVTTPTYSPKPLTKRLSGDDLHRDTRNENERRMSRLLNSNQNKYITLKLSLSTERIRLLVLNTDCCNQCSPIAEMLVSHSNMLFSLTSHNQIRVQSTVKCSSDYFNHRIGKWEPLLEPWSIKVLSQISSSAISKQPTVALRVESDRILNMNVTEEFLESLSGAANFWNAELDVARVTKTTYRVRNETGLTLSMWISNQRSRSTTLASGDESSLDFDPQTTMNMRKRLSVVVHAPEEFHGSFGEKDSPWGALQDIPIEKGGSLLYRVPKTDVRDHDLSGYLVYIPTLSVVCDVIPSGATTHICIRSSFILRNRCTGPMEFKIMFEGKSIFNMHLAPAGTLALPVHLAELISTRRCDLLVRPAAFNDAFGLQLLSLPKAMATDGSLPCSLRANLYFPSTTLVEETATYCGVDFRSGDDAVRGLQQEIEVDRNQPRTLKSTPATSVISGITDVASHLHERVKRRGSVTHSRIFVRVLSFESPVLISNLLASSVTYRVRGSSKSAAADGQLHIGSSLRWQGVATSDDITLCIRLPGFDWSSMLEIPGVPYVPIADTQKSTQDLYRDDASKGAIEWSAAQTSSTNTRTPSLKYVELKDANRRTLSVCVETEICQSGLRKIVLYVPYWIKNMSDLHLLVRSASRTAQLAESLGGHIAAGQNEAIAVMRRLRLRQKLGERTPYHYGGVTGATAPGGLLDLLDDPKAHVGQSTSEPLMFSYTNISSRKGRICVKSTDSSWSQTIGLDSAGTNGVIELKQQWNVRSNKPRKAFVVGVSISVAEGQFSRTKIISLSNRFLLVNGLGRTLNVQQRGSYPNMGIFSWSSLGVFSSFKGPQRKSTPWYNERSKSMLSAHSEFIGIRPGEKSPFHWMNAQSPREICVRFDEYGWVWSGSFPIDNIGEFYVRMRNEHTHAVYILRVEISIDKTIENQAAIMVTFRPEVPNMPPYRIDNLSLQTLRLKQIQSYSTGAPMETQEVLLPYHSCPYTWDDVQLPRTIFVESMGHKGNVAVDRHKSIWRRAMSTVYGIWAILSDQAATDVTNNDPIALGEFELDRLQGATPCTALPHITVGVHADGPTRVLSIVDARNETKPAATPPEERIDRWLGDDLGLIENLGSESGSAFDSESESDASINEGDKKSQADDMEFFPGADIGSINGAIASQQVEVSLGIQGIGISVISASPRRELLYVSVLGILVEHQSSSDLQRTSVNVEWVQIDNQIIGTYYPVLLAPRIWRTDYQQDKRLQRESSQKEFMRQSRAETRLRTLTYQTAGNMSVDPLKMSLLDQDEEFRFFLQCSLVKSVRFPGLEFVKYFSLKIAPMNLKMEPELLTSMISFALRCAEMTSSVARPKPRVVETRGGQRESPAISSTVHASQSYAAKRDLILSGGRHEEDATIPTRDKSTSESSKSVPVDFSSSQKKLYIEELQIHPVNVHVSFSFRTNKNSDVGRGFAYGNALRFALQAMGASLANVENASLQLHPLLLHHSLSTYNTIMKSILDHYKVESRRQAYIILGSVDLLGDPLGLVSNLGAGVVDFFYEPALGLARSPQDFGAGIARGTRSLIRKTILGATTSTTGFITGTTALLESLTMDKYSGFRPNTVTEGIVMGLAGSVMSPMIGLKMHGVIGLGQGIVLGLLGLVVKPLTGFLSLIKHISMAIQSTVDPSVKRKHERIRPPRSFQATHILDDLFDGTKVLGVYDFDSSLGEEILTRVDGGVYLEDQYLSHMSLPLPITPEVPIIDHELKMANELFLFYTMEHTRPHPKLPLWKPMHLVRTHSHLLYIEDTSNIERTNWAISINTIQHVEMELMVEAIDQDDDPYDENASLQSTLPLLSYWVIKIYATKGSENNIVRIYSWTKSQAEVCEKFCNSLVVSS